MIPNSKIATRNSELRLLLIMSSPEELRPFLHTVRHRRAFFQGGRAWNFQGRGFSGLALLVGMGGTLPRLLTVRAIAAYPPDMVIIAGFGGALTALPPPGGVLVASECWRLAPAGKQLRPIDFSPPAPPAALASLLQNNGLPVATGALVTTPVVMTKGFFAPPGFPPAFPGVGPGNSRNCRRRPSSSPALSGGPHHHRRRRRRNPAISRRHCQSAPGSSPVTTPYGSEG